MIKEYEFYYKDLLIGFLYVDETTHQHSYQPIHENVIKIKDEVVLTVEMEKGTNGYVASLPFFQERLKYMKIWNLKKIAYHTDYFVLKEKDS